MIKTKKRKNTQCVIGLIVKFSNVKPCLKLTFFEKRDCFCKFLWSEKLYQKIFHIGN